MLHRLMPNLDGYTVSYLHALAFRWLLIALMIAFVVFAAKSILFPDLADGAPMSPRTPGAIVTL